MSERLFHFACCVGVTFFVGWQVGVWRACRLINQRTLSMRGPAVTYIEKQGLRFPLLAVAALALSFSLTLWRSVLR